mgnify:CR=1 FL=1
MSLNVLDAMTRREKQILALVTDGKSNKEIARILGIAMHTVEKHLDNIYKKLNVNNRTAAAKIYTRYNLEE